MESYGHALGVLGDVARRNDHSAVRPYSAEESARAHVRTDHADAPAGEAAAAAAGAPGAPEGPSVEREPPAVSIPWSGRAFRFGETEPVGAAPTPPAPPEEPSTAATPRVVTPPVSTPPVSTPPAAQPRSPAALGFGEIDEEPVVARRRLAQAGLGGQSSRRMAVTGAAAAVALLAVALLGWKLAGSGGHKSASPPATNSSGSHHRASGGHHHAPSPSTTTTLPSTLKPVSTSSTVVAFNVTSKSYVLTFADSGTEGCWIGVQASQNGPWLWMTTLGPGQAATYDASGPTVVRLGAPKYVGVKVDGVPAELPGFSLPYDLTFSAGSGPANA